MSSNVNNNYSVQMLRSVKPVEIGTYKMIPLSDGHRQYDSKLLMAL